MIKNTFSSKGERTKQSKNIMTTVASSRTQSLALTSRRTASASFAIAAGHLGHCGDSSASRGVILGSGEPESQEGSHGTFDPALELNRPPGPGEESSPPLALLDLEALILLECYLQTDGQARKVVFFNMNTQKMRRAPMTAPVRAEGGDPPSRLVAIGYSTRPPRAGGKAVCFTARRSHRRAAPCELAC